MPVSSNYIFSARNLVCKRGDTVVLRVDKFSVPVGETVAVIGPNGAGKSTLLLAIAQLLKPNNGEMYFKGEAIQEQQQLKLRRKIALVLQDPLLINASVFENVALGLRYRKINKKAIRQQVNYWLDRLGIGHLGQRRASQLSGGEAQRASLARAFVLQPDLLLLDEPFGALDAQTRSNLLDEYHALVAEMNLSTVFVTHDLDEALFLGDQVAVILEGEMRQQGPADEIFSAPLDVDIAAFVGVETVIPGVVVDRKNGLVTMQTKDGYLEAVADLQPGQNAYYCLRPEDITLWQQEDLPVSSARNCLLGKISKLMTQGPLVKVGVDCGFLVTALVTRQSAKEMNLEIGKKVAATFKASAAHLITHHV